MQLLNDSILLAVNNFSISSYLCSGKVLSLLQPQKAA